MSAMIERVARAIWGSHWDEATEGGKNVTREEARAAIAAMREPTEAMCKAAISSQYHTIGAVWGGMIDAALAEP